jgi:hypothetical protein
MGERATSRKFMDALRSSRAQRGVSLARSGTCTAMGMRLRVVGASLLVALSASGCASTMTAARDDFGRTFSCPDGRVDARAREDLAGRLVTSSDRALARGEYPVEASPAPEVTGDPERLAKWQRDQSANREAQARRLASLHARETIYEVHGCEHTLFLACEHPVSRRGATVMNQVRCRALPATPDGTEPEDASVSDDAFRLFTLALRRGASQKGTRP